MLKRSGSQFIGPSRCDTISSRDNEIRMTVNHLVKISLRLTALVWLLPSIAAMGQQPEISYNHDVRPILSDKCFFCHGPDPKHRQADVRLDIPDEIDLDEVVARIKETDADLKMPPPESHKTLTDKQIDVIERWVEAGGKYEAHWAYLAPVVDKELTNGDKHAVDHFVQTKLKSLGLRPEPEADRRSLIRRLSLDLTGLPPSREEIETFLNDRSSTAYEDLVDRFLAKPQYGEHAARYWLDLVRFADTNGLHHDHYREMTPYRDWVIRAFNDNLAFDQFISSQIAGDLMESPSVDQQIASGFNRLHLIIDRGTALPEESFTRNVVDRVSSIGTAFLGLTLECAVCHDHKYDPITQRDFYQLYAFFNNFDGGPETGGRGGLDFKRGLQPPYLELPTEKQKGRLAELDHSIKSLAGSIKTLESSEEKSTDSTAKELEDLRKRLADDKASKNKLIEQIPATLVMKERSEIRPAHILVRGNYDQPGEMVQRDTPAFLPPMEESDAPRTRLHLARWLVAPSNPLTARVAVNRFWQQIFGVGLVKTSEDFGAQGEPPSHPKLLDHLTVRFVESGWDVKSLMRYIVLSQTYRQSSRSARSRFVADPQNRMLARGSRYRLDAEVIRDQVLMVSGLLNPALYGRSVKPPQPAGLWKIVAMPSSYPNVFKADSGDKIFRRSVYSFWKRGLPPPQMTIFDAPTRESCVARRERTNTPLQALVLMNEEQYFAAATHFAATLLQRTDLSNDERLSLAYESVTSRLPDDETLETLLQAWNEFRDLYADDPGGAEELIQAKANTSLPKELLQRPVDLAATTMVIHSMLNLDETRTRE